MRSQSLYYVTLMSVLLLQTCSHTALAAGEDTQHGEHEHSGEHKHVLSCGFCGQRVAEPTDIFYRETPSALERDVNIPTNADGTVPPLQQLLEVSHRLENKHDTRFDVVTFYNATVGVEAEATPSDTWFPGYSWRIAFCSKCGVHLGWRFVRDDRVINGMEVTEGEGTSSGALDAEGEHQDEDNLAWFYGLVLDRLVFKSVLKNIMDSVVSL